MDKREIIEKARKEIEHKDKHKMHEEKIISILSWINIFHWTSPAIIDFLTYKSCKRGFTSKLRREKLIIEKEPIPSWPWLPRKMIILSRIGRERLRNTKDITIWTGKIAQGHFAHDYLIQFYIAKFLFKKHHSLRIRINKKYNKKIYDAVVTISESNINKVIGVEIELSRKKHHEVSNMFCYISQDIIQNHIQEVHIAYNREVVANQFLYFMQNSLTEQGNYVFYLYKRYNNNSKYEKTSEKVVISQEDLKIKFIEIPFPPILYPKKPKPKPKPKEPIKLKPKPKEIEEIEDPEEEIYEDNYFNDDDL